jgi:hypothetical protein
LQRPGLLRLLEHLERGIWEARKMPRRELIMMRWGMPPPPK